ncbi:MAG: peptidoglycan editing factor PgeF [Prevotella sp.]|nr:peptidoglycan editing factor PgeF [Prevotella sp.]MBO5641147.1 peptidoglycan editing factor PgeF [Prevotella sp.]
MIYYNLGENITSFTTDRTIGRDETRLLGCLPVRASRLVYPHQTHTDRIAVIDSQMLSLSVSECKARLEGIDAVISDQSGVAMGISTADCIPVLVYDAAHHAAAAIHAGWRGTVARIVEKTLAVMADTYGTVPSQCVAAIGPGISQDSFEVGQEVVDQFAEAGFQMDQYVIMKRKPHIDLKAINREQLLNSGLEACNITVSDVDTYTDERFFSARREQLPPAADGTVVKCGRILSGFVLTAKNN